MLGNFFTKINFTRKKIIILLLIYTIFRFIPVEFWTGLTQGIIQNLQGLVHTNLLTAAWIVIALSIFRDTTRRITETITGLFRSVKADVPSMDWFVERYADRTPQGVENAHGNTRFPREDYRQAASRGRGRQ